MKCFVNGSHITPEFLTRAFLDEQSDLMRIPLRMGVGRSDAEDVLHEAYFAMFLRVNRGPPFQLKGFYGEIKQYVHSAAIDFIRKRIGRYKSEKESPRLVYFGDFTRREFELSLSDPRNNDSTNDLDGLFDTVFDSGIDSRDVGIFIDYFVKGVTQRRIAKTYRLSGPRVCQIIGEVRTKLTRALKQRGYGLR